MPQNMKSSDRTVSDSAVVCQLFQAPYTRLSQLKHFRLCDDAQYDKDAKRMHIVHTA